MSIGTRRTLIAVCALSGVLLLVGPGPNMMAQSEPGGEPFAGGAVKGMSVLVEAFVVEVNLPALAQQGVSPVGSQPHATTVADLLECLDGGRARILGGAKISAKPGMQVDTQTKRKTYVRSQRPAPQVSYTSIESGGSFSVTVEPVSEIVVSVDFAFTGSRLMQKKADTDTPPGTESWNWSGSVALDLGEPQIAGASQGSETAVFLVLTANARE